MPVTYDDLRYSYDYGPPGQPYSLTYNGALLVPTPAGNQPAPSGTLTFLVNHKQALAGTQPAATATLIGRNTRTHTALSGTQPSATATLSGRIIILRQLTGAQPYPTAQLSPSKKNAAVLDGVQAAPAGQLAVRVQYKRQLTGTQPYPTGQGVGHYRYTRTLTGNQPVLFTVLYDDPRFTYDDPATLYNGGDPGHLTWRSLFIRGFVGEQPYPTGELEIVRGQWVWATYHDTLYDRPEEVHYVLSFDSDEDVVYSPSTSGPEQGVVYVDTAIHRQPESSRR